MSRPARAPHSTPRKPSPGQNPPAILCIEDDRSGLTARKAVLQSAGYRVITADSGGTGLEIAKTRHLDLALIDCQMPGMSGYAVAALLRAIQPGTRILLLSAFPPPPAQMNGELDGILIKGQPAPRFLEQIADHLAKLCSRPLSRSDARDSVA